MKSGTPPKFPHSISLLTWGYNEEALIDEFMERALRLLESVTGDFEIIYVNDGSTDRSAEILKKWEAREPRLRVITNERNLNVGWNVRTAVSAAKKDYLLWQMVDWCYDISNLRFFLELLKHADIVQGVRVASRRGLHRIPILGVCLWGLRRSDNPWKGFISVVNYLLLRLLFRVPLRDFQNVTIYPRELAQSLDLVGTSSFINPEMLFKSFWRGASFIEVPINFLPREKGEAKGTKIRFVIRSAGEILYFWWHWIAFREVRNRKRGEIHSLESFANLEPEIRRIFYPHRPGSPDAQKGLWNDF